MTRPVLSAAVLVLFAAGCTTDPISWVIGQAATPEVVERAQFESRSRDVRVIEPGQAVTLDYRGDRLNLHVNQAGAIHQATCG